MQAHEAIRADPGFEKKERSAPSDKKIWKPKKLTYDERKASLKVRLSRLLCNAIAVILT